MKARILDPGALAAISPAALAAYVRGEGWKKTEAYGNHADVYIGEDKPEIILSRTDRFVDYVAVVSRLVGILGEVTGPDELAVYRDLKSVDQDVVRVRTITARTMARSRQMKALKWLLKPGKCFLWRPVPPECHSQYIALVPTVRLQST